MKTETVSYKNFGSVLFCSTEYAKIGVTLDIGPRIIYFSTPQGENVFFEDTERYEKNTTSTVTDFYGSGRYWYLYGGHRLWAGPERMPMTYYPDNDPVDFSVADNIITVRARPRPQTGEAVEMRIKMLPERVEVEHRITNTGDAEKRLCAWALSVMAGGGECVVPWSSEDTGLLANRNISVWPYTDISDRRLRLEKRYLSVTQMGNDVGSFKIGISNDVGIMYYFNRGCLFRIEYATDHKHGTYADRGVSCEIFTCRHFLEMESLSPLALLSPGESIAHTEIWRIDEGLEQAPFLS